MPERPIKLQSLERGIFRRLLEKLFGKQISAILEHIKRNPDQERTILFSFLLSVLVQKTIVSLIVALVAFLGLPQLVLLAYAMFNGLPVFDVFDAMGNYRSTFAGLAALFTAILVVTLALPGWCWSFDKPVRDISWFKPREMGSKNYWIHLRWALAFLPGVLLVAVVSLFLPTHVVPDRHFAFALSVSLVVASAVVVIRDYVLYRLGRMDRGEDSDERTKSIAWRQVFREPDLIVATNFASFLYVATYMAAVARFLEQNKILDPFITPGEAVSDTLSIAVTAFITIALLLGTTRWAAQKKPWTPLVVFTALYLGVLFIYPGGSTLLRNYMAGMRVGGGTPVEVSVDGGSAELWPAIFAAHSAKTSDGMVRSAPVSLMLLGKEKVFLKPVHAKPGEPDSGALMIERSRIREILFLGRVTAN